MILQNINIVYSALVPIFFSYFYQASPPQKKKWKNVVFYPQSSHDRIEKKIDSFIKLYRSLGVSGLCKFIGAGEKKSEPTEVPYPVSPHGDIEDLTSYTIPRASDEYTCKSKTG